MQINKYISKVIKILSRPNFLPKITRKKHIKYARISSGRVQSEPLKIVPFGFVENISWIEFCNSTGKKILWNKYVQGPVDWKFIK